MAKNGITYLKKNTIFIKMILINETIKKTIFLLTILIMMSFSVNATSSENTTDYIVWDNGEPAINGGYPSHTELLHGYGWTFIGTYWMRYFDKTQTWSSRNLIAYDGNMSIGCESTSEGDCNYYYTLQQNYTTNVTTSIYIAKDGLLVGLNYFYIGEISGANNVDGCIINMNDAGINLIGDTTVTLKTGTTINTWYKVDVTLDPINKKCYGIVDNNQSYQGNVSKSTLDHISRIKIKTSSSSDRGLYIDRIRLWNGSIIDEPQIPPMSINWDSDTPSDNTVQTSTFDFNYTLTNVDTSANCTLYKDSVLQNTSTGVTDGINTIQYTVLSESANRQFHISCIDEALTIANTTTKNIRIDDVPTVIIPNYPVIANTTVINNELILNISINDDFLNNTLINISYSGIEKYFNSTTEISPTVYYYDIINTTSWDEGIYLLEISGGD